LVLVQSGDAVLKPHGRWQRSAVLSLPPPWMEIFTGVWGRGLEIYLDD
jgi:hypothetical protein